MGADIVVVLEREKIVITLLVQSLQNHNSSPPQITLKCRDIGVTCHLRQKRVIFRSFSRRFLVGLQQVGGGFWQFRYNVQCRFSKRFYSGPDACSESPLLVSLERAEKHVDLPNLVTMGFSIKCRRGLFRKLRLIGTKSKYNKNRQFYQPVFQC